MNPNNSSLDNYYKQCIQCKKEFPRSYFISKRGTSICMLCKDCRKGHRERQRRKSPITLNLINRTQEPTFATTESSNI